MEAPIMADKRTKPGFKGRAGPKAAPNPRRTSKDVANSPTDKPVPVGGESSIEVSDPEEVLRRRLFGVYPALVTSIEESGGRGRVKVKLFWSPDGGGDSFEVWARVAVTIVGRNDSTRFMPLPNDKVLIAFADGDPQSPIVVGALYILSNTNEKIGFDDAGGEPLELKYRPGLVELRVGSGNVITIDSSDASVKADTMGLTTAAKVDQRESSLRFSKRETGLLGRINAGLSEPQARRLKWLDSRRQEETLTPEEHAELLGLVDESERLAVGRAEALVELARLRGATVQSLMEDLGLGVAGCG
jgi:hypothetical protein